MTESLSLHCVGTLCVVGIVWIVCKLARHFRVLKRRTAVWSFFLGLLFGILGATGVFIHMVSVKRFWRWIPEPDDNYLASLLTVSIVCLLSAFVSGKIGAYCCRKYLSGEVIVLAALMAGVFMILQPIAYGWLQWLV